MSTAAERVLAARKAMTETFDEQRDIARVANRNAAQKAWNLSKAAFAVESLLCCAADPEALIDALTIAARAAGILPAEEPAPKPEAPKRPHNVCGNCGSDVKYQQGLEYGVWVHSLTGDNRCADRVSEAYPERAS